MSFDPLSHPDFLAALTTTCLDREGRHERGEIIFRCPAPDHPDRHPSARWNPAKAVWRCDVCRAKGGALDLADRLGIPKPARGGVPYPPQHTCNTATPPGCTLAGYAGAKRLPVAFLRSLGLSDITYQAAPAVRIPYRHPDGTDGPIQFRVALEKPPGGGDRFRWKSGAKAMLYGLDRLDHARKQNSVVIVEGASDCHTLWHHGEPAVGLPGAGAWKESRDAPHLDGIETVYVVIEPDQGGQVVTSWLASSAIRDRVRLIDLGAFKDPSELHLDDPDRFAERWRVALEAATPWADVAEQEASAEAADARSRCAELATEPRILDLVAEALTAAGVSGEQRNAKVIYLIVTSRLLGRPISAAIKGPSSAGKSYVLDHVLALFPPAAYYALSAMSDRALAYDDEPLAHRMLVLYEAAGLSGDMATYLMRSLLSEGLVRYVTVERTSEGLRPRLIERPGPTGLLVTTTATPASAASSAAN